MPSNPAAICEHNVTLSLTGSHTPPGSGESKPLLHITIDNSREGVVRTLLNSGVDINERDPDGSTALQHSIATRGAEAARCHHQAAPETRDHFKTRLAIYSNFETQLRILLDHDACKCKEEEVKVM